MLFDDIQKVYELAIAYIGNGRYFAFAMASLLFLFVTSKKIRPRLIYPTLLVIFLIGTPWLYHYIFNRDAYWRTFWMFPGSILIALFCVRLIQTCETVRERVGMTVFLLFLLFFMGTNMYSAVRTRPNGTKETILAEVTNPEKITEGTKQVADILLAVEESPKVIARKKYIYELRQYSSKIKLYYGRDIDGFIIPVSQKNGWRAEVHKQLESSSPNYYRILRIADDAGYNFVITSSTYRIDENILDMYGYREIAILDSSAIYYKANPNGSMSETVEGEEPTEQEVVTEEVLNPEETVPDISTDSVSEQAGVDTAGETTASVEAETELSAEEGYDTAEEGYDTAGEEYQETDGTELLEQFAENS